MPQLTYVARPDGLFVDVVVGLSGAATAVLFAAGQPIATPLRARGIIDTGTDVSAISTALLQRLGVPLHRQGSTQTVAGPMNVNLFKVSLGITDFGKHTAPELVEANLVVMELPSALPNIEVLVGLDVLMNCKMVLDGTRQLVTLDF